MYLGQCMQLQSDNSSSSTAQIVPFRQCKLTELLFSNSYPSTNSRSDNTPKKAPQKAIMIVTADPLGDFNATSQILRYSALAREVTVPRVPSVTSTIAQSIPAFNRPGTAMSTSGMTSGRNTPALPSQHQMEAELQQAFNEIAMLREELEIQALRLQEETNRRRQAEQSWKAAESRTDSLEQEIREEVWGEMEAQLEQEQRRWKAARDNDREDGEAFVDRKLDILAKGMEDMSVIGEEDELDVYEDEDEEPSMLERTEELEDENERLREQIREMQMKEVREKENQRSPSKKMRVLKQRRWEGSEVGLDGSP